MAKKNETTLIVLAAVAVAGYFAFRKGGVLNPTPAASLNQLRTAQPLTANPNFSPVPGVATELPDLPDIGIIAPALDPTGMQITLY